MTKIVSIANQKGGVGKTTTAINLAAFVSTFDKRVLLIDFDPQGNSASGLGIDRSAIVYSSYDMLINDIPPEDIIQKTNHENFDIIPATIALAGAEVELVQMIAREHILSDALHSVHADYDFIFIDCPPSLGLLTLNAFTASQSILVPIQCEYFALEGLTQLMSTVQIVQKRLNSILEMEGFVLTMYDGRTNLSNQVVSEVQRHFTSKVYRTVIPRSIRLGEAPSYGQSIVEYAPNSSAGKAYLSLAKEFMQSNP